MDFFNKPLSNLSNLKVQIVEWMIKYSSNYHIWICILMIKNILNEKYADHLLSNRWKRSSSRKYVYMQYNIKSSHKKDINL